MSYEDLYGLAEELMKLIGARLQVVLSPDPLRFELQFFSGSERWLILDLNPARPLILSTSLTPLKKTKKKTPIYNFLNAHFISGFLEKIEVAEKPNRTLRLSFGHGEKKSILTFKCYPHGQELLLEADAKSVVAPWRPSSKRSLDEIVSFVEPAAVDGWRKNDFFYEQMMKTSLKRVPELRSEPYFLKLQKKLEKAIQNIDSTFEPQKEQDAERMTQLEAQAIELQQQPKVDGEELGRIYDEVRKLRKKNEVTLKRREDLAQQLEFLKSPEGQTQFAEKPGRVSVPVKKAFSGTVVRIDGHFELWVGRTDWQNDDLVRLASPHDLWIHLRDYAGAHGVIRGPKKTEIPQSLIEFSCRVVAILSQSKKNPFQEGQPLDFIVTPRKFVKKPKGAPPGRVIVERESVRRVAFRSIKFEVT